jgi:nucleotide-binding universal stress UspA family protein
MEKEDAEQTSEEERKNLDEEKQRTAGEKLNEELIDLALKLQGILCVVGVRGGWFLGLWQFFVGCCLPWWHRHLYL